MNWTIAPTKAASTYKPQSHVASKVAAILSRPAPTTPTYTPYVAPTPVSRTVTKQVKASDLVPDVWNGMCEDELYDLIGEDEVIDDIRLTGYITIVAEVMEDC